MSTPEKTAQVAIIVRTKDRLPLLKRALLDIAEQTYKNYWVTVVNDGGSAGEANKIVESFCEKLGDKITLINHPKSLGKWRAANEGVKNSTSTFIVLHDDDDTWEPKFLEETVAFLGAQEGKYIGVATFSDEIFERETEGKVEQVSKRQFAPGFKHISIDGLCKHNMFPPISYLYRRTLHDEIGYYNEDLFALADWEFNLRTVEKYDIGMVHKRLAYWHIRDVASQYANVTNAKDDAYQENITLLINDLLRKDLARGKLGIGHLVSQRYYEREENEHLLHYVDQRLNETSALIQQGYAGHFSELNDKLSELLLAINTLVSKRVTRQIKRTATHINRTYRRKI